MSPRPSSSTSPDSRTTSHAPRGRQPQLGHGARDGRQQPRDPRIFLRHRRGAASGPRRRGSFPAYCGAEDLAAHAHQRVVVPARERLVGLEGDLEACRGSAGARPHRAPTGCGARPRAPRRARRCPRRRRARCSRARRARAGRAGPRRPRRRRGGSAAPPPGDSRTRRPARAPPRPRRRPGRAAGRSASAPARSRRPPIVEPRALEDAHAQLARIRGPPPSPRSARGCGPSCPARCSSRGTNSGRRGAGSGRRAPSRGSRARGSSPA